jgi:hypothetical protein
MYATQAGSQVTDSATARNYGEPAPQIAADFTNSWRFICDLLMTLYLDNLEMTDPIGTFPSRLGTVSVRGYYPSSFSSSGRVEGKPEAFLANSGSRDYFRIADNALIISKNSDHSVQTENLSDS